MSKLSDRFYKKLKLRGLCTEKPTATELKDIMMAIIKKYDKEYYIYTIRDSHGKFGAGYKDKSDNWLHLRDEQGTRFRIDGGKHHRSLANALAVVLIKLDVCGKNYITTLNYRKKLLCQNKKAESKT